MMPQWIQSAIQVVTGAVERIFDPKFMLILSALCAIPLFAPAFILSYFGLASIAAHYRPWFALGFGFGLLYFIMFGVWPLFKAKRKRKRAIGEMVHYLTHLGADQQQLLSEFLTYRKSTIMVPPSREGIANTLVANEILYLSSDKYFPNQGRPYSIVPSAMEFIINNQAAVFHP